jgi:hypothetical protein
VSEFAFSDRDIWVDISDLSSWYKPIDICQLTQEIGDIRDYHVNQCKSSTRILACDASKSGIGLGGPKRMCYPPYKRRTFFWKMIEKFNDPKKRYIHSILTKAYNMQRPLLFIGDSITYQSVDAFLCEAYRVEGNEVKDIYYYILI